MKLKTMTILATLVLLSMPALSTEDYSEDYIRGFDDAIVIIGPIIAEKHEIFGESLIYHAMDEYIKELNDSEMPPEGWLLAWQYAVAYGLNDTEGRRLAFNENVTKPDDRIIERFGEEAAQNFSAFLTIPPLFAPEEESSIPPTTDEPIESPLGSSKSTGSDIDLDLYMSDKRGSIETTESEAPFGSRENPVPMREYSVTLSDGWKITVLDVIPDATQLVLKENMFNDPPKSGYQFFLAKVRACYTGSGSDKFDGGFRLRAVGASNIAYSTFENSCGVIPDKLPDPEVFTGGCIEGYVGWEIRSSDANSLVMYDNPLFGSAGDRLYISLME